MSETSELEAEILRRLKATDEDAEIERLKADFQKAKEWNQICELQITNLQSIVENQCKLITELADALEEQSCWSTKVELIQRAREATK